MLENAFAHGLVEGTVDFLELLLQVFFLFALDGAPHLFDERFDLGLDLLISRPSPQALSMALRY